MRVVRGVSVEEPVHVFRECLLVEKAGFLATCIVLCHDLVIALYG